MAPVRRIEKGHRPDDRIRVTPKADLVASRARGYYSTHGENVSDVMAIAAPLTMGTSTFGVAIAGPRQRMAEKEATLGKKLLRSMKTLEANSQSKLER